MDPDCVFLEPLTGSVARGYPPAQPYSYMDPMTEAHMELVGKHCRNQELVDSAGISILIHRDDLAAVAPLWLKKTVEIRRDRRSREIAGWVAEMWAYAFAAADLGLKHMVREMTRVDTEDLADLPIVHYCYGSSHPEDKWWWDKWSYKPWERVSEPPAEVPSACRAVINLLDEWIAMPEHQICLYED